MNFKIIKHTFIFGLSCTALIASAKDDAMSIKVPSEDKSTERMEEKLKQEKAKADKKNSFFGGFSGASPKLSADDPIVFDEETQTMYAKGNVKIEEKQFEIDSDAIEYKQKTSLAKVDGDVRISLENLRIVANEVEINTAEDKISSSKVRLGNYPLFTELKDLETSKAKTTAKDTIIYYNEPALASLNIQAGKFSYDTDTKLLEVEDATLQIGDIPLMYYPYLSIEDPRVPPIDLKMNYGYNSDLGLFGKNSILYTGWDSIDAGGIFDFYTDRGVLFGPAAKFNYSSASTRIWGQLRSGYIHDNGLTGSLAYDSQGELIHSDRGFIDLDYKQKIGDNIEITALLNYWSDSEVLRDFRDGIFEEDEIPDNFVELSFYESDYIASIFARFEPNEWEDVQERLPELSFNALPMNLFGVGIYQTAYASVVNLREYDETYDDTLSTNRIDAYYGLDMPIALNSWSTLSPVIGARATYYTDTMSNSDYAKVQGQIGFDFNMNAWGTWDIESNSLDLNGLRHNLRPIMMYRYISGASQGANDIYSIDEDVFSTSPEILDLGLSRDIDDLGETSTLRLGLENTFYTRADGYGSRKIASLNFYQDFNFIEQKVYSNSEEYEYSHYSNLFAGFDLYPAEWLSFGLYSRTDVETGDVNQADFYFRLYDGDSVGLTFTSNYTADQISQYWIKIDYKITENYKFWARWRYDAELDELTEQVYSLYTRVGNAWNIEYQLKLTSGSSRDDGVTFSVLFGLIDF